MQLAPHSPRTHLASDATHGGGHLLAVVLSHLGGLVKEALLLWVGGRGAQGEGVQGEGVQVRRQAGWWQAVQGPRCQQAELPARNVVLVPGMTGIMGTRAHISQVATVQQ